MPGGVQWPPNADAPGFNSPFGGSTPREGRSGLSTPTSATLTLPGEASEDDPQDERRRSIPANVYRRRRSTIVPETIFGKPEGQGPLRIGAFFRATKPEHQLMTWEELVSIITQGDLEQLLRHPDCEREYMNWARSIKRHYGGLEQYIAKERIGWDTAASSSQSSTGGSLPSVQPSKGTRPHRSGSSLREDSSTEAAVADAAAQPPPAAPPAPMSTFFDDAAAAAAENENSAVVRVVFNDWPYAVPLDCQHYVVWSRFPIIDQGLFETADTPFPAGPLRELAYQGIAADGTRGATGTIIDVAPQGDRTPHIFREGLEGPAGKEALAAAADILSQESDHPTDSLDDKIFVLSKAAHAWAARYANRFITQHWNVEDYETAWFCNPPHLRTVPGLSHFHVIVRPKPAPAEVQDSLLFSTS